MTEGVDAVAPGELIRDRWKVIKKLGEGGFGAVFEVYDMQMHENAALKLENANEKFQVLKMEVAVMRRLQGKPHACRFYGCGRNDRFNYVVMQLVGKNLGDYKRECTGGRFSISTGIRLSMQCLKSIDDIHSVGFLHRDIKPSNYAMGRGGKDMRTVFMLDFGLARQYVTAHGDVRAPRAAVGFRGTVRYASVAAHENKELGRHDDLWCLFYMMVECMVGALPWRNVQDKEEVGRMKKDCLAITLLKNAPNEFNAFYEHLKQLCYKDRPDYQMLMNLLDKILKTHRVRSDDPYDWETGAARVNRGSARPDSDCERFGDEQEREKTEVDDPYGVPEAMPRGRRR